MSRAEYEMSFRNDGIAGEERRGELIGLFDNPSMMIFIGVDEGSPFKVYVLKACVR